MLTGGDVAETDRLVEQLLDLHLLQQVTAGRYRFHPLVRAYAAELATTSDDERDALTRLFDYYLYSISLAVKAAPALSDHDQAVDWLETEHPNLLAAAAYAAGHGWSAHADRFPFFCGHVWTRSEPNVFLRRRERGACLADL